MYPNEFVNFPIGKGDYKKIMKKLEKVENNQQKILSMLKSKNNTKLDSAEIFFKTCKINSIPIAKAADLIYPSIYSTREHAIKAIKTLQKKGVLAIKNGYILVKNKEVK